MLHRVTIRAAQLSVSQAFYDAVMPVIGGRDLSLVAAEHVDHATRGLHVGFAAASRELVDAFWQAGTDAGCESAGDPGERPHYTQGYYGAFLLDPAGNSIEAVHHPGVREAGRVDHVWLRVSDQAASTAFYEDLSDRTGFSHQDDEGRSWFTGDGGSFTLVEGEPTRNAGLTFDADDGDTVTDPDGNTIELRPTSVRDSPE